MAAIRERLGEVVSRSGLSMRNFSEAAGLSKNYVSMIIRGEVGDLTTNTLEQLARVGKVSFDYLATGRQDGEILPIYEELEAHRSRAFPPAARAFLELHRASDSSVAMVRAFLRARFNPLHEWTPDEWLDEMRREFLSRSRALTLP